MSDRPEKAKPSLTNTGKSPRRCGWCGEDPLYVKYHDEEWGRKTTEDSAMFEFLVLESAQAGLSWITILRKRENYRKAFANFEAKKVAKFTQKHVDKLLLDPGIVRNRLKIHAAISNARLFLEACEQFGSFHDYLISFFPGKKPIINHWKSLDEIPATSEISDAISKDMKKRGFKFFGSTIAYSHLQAVGLINDHLESCDFKYR